MQSTANISEIFSSIQGEGPRAGERHLFVRFHGCSLCCQYCDTPISFLDNAQCCVEEIPFSRKMSYRPNPLTIGELNKILSSFNGVKTLAVTGGEPLESVEFLREWLPTVARRYIILLETAGIHYQELEKVLPWVDVVSMDVKLPSVTGMKSYWEEHRQFAAKAREKEWYAKAVVSAKTSDYDVDKAIELVADIDKKTPFIMQPATPFGRFRDAPSEPQLAKWRERASLRLSEVKIIPQLHKMLGVL